MISKKDMELAHIVLLLEGNQDKSKPDSRHGKCKGPAVAGAPQEKTGKEAVCLRVRRGLGLPHLKLFVSLASSFNLLSPFSLYFCNSGLCSVPQTWQALCLNPLYLLFPLPEHPFPRLLTTVFFPSPRSPSTCHIISETFPTTEYKVALLSSSPSIPLCLSPPDTYVNLSTLCQKQGQHLGSVCHVLGAQ